MLAVALFRHGWTTPVEVTKREMEEALAVNWNTFATLTQPGLEATFSPSDGCPESVPPGGTAMVPICIEFGKLSYWAIVSLEVKTIPIEAGSVRFIAGHPRVIEDGVVERSEFQVAALNARAMELGKDGCVIVGTLADAEHRDDV
jgi:hypothetical protein